MKINLRKQFDKIKRNKITAKLLMIELMKISTIDFSVNHMSYKLYKYGFPFPDCQIYKWMEQLVNEGFLIFSGWKPEKINGRLIGYEGIYALPAGVKKIGMYHR